MLGRSHLQDAYMENNEIIKHDGRDIPFTVSVYGEVIVKEFETHVRISKDDWNKYKQRLIPAFKQGDMKHGSTETGS
jgi:hypothetical protein